MKLGSLFDGSGGFPLAGSLCGIEPVWASEVEPYPIAVTKSRFPKMKHLGNICNINGAEIEPVDIITFGSPCQDLSVAGKRAGLKHEDNGDEETTRSGLFMEAVRIIKEMRSATNGRYPTFALWENVPGAFSSNQGEDFRIVLEELIKIAEPTAKVPAPPKGGWAYADIYLGDRWSLAYRVFDAQYWGVPQRRRRIHLIADLRGGRAGEILFKSEGLRGYFAESGEAWQGAAGDAEDCSGATDREGENGQCQQAVVFSLEPGIAASEGGHIYEGVSGTLRANAVDNQMAVAYSFDSLASNSMKSKNPHSGCRVVDVAKTLDTTSPDPSKNQGGIAIVEKIVLDDQGGSQINVRTDGKAPTIRAEMHGNVPCVMEAMGFDMYNQQSTGNISRTLKTPVGGDDLPVVCVKCYDARGNGDGADNSTITGDHENRTTDYTSVVIEPIPIHDQATRFSGKRGDKDDGKGNGLGIGEPGDPMNTLTSGDRHAVAYAMQAFGKYAESDKASAMKARDYKDATDLVVECAGINCRNMTEYPELYPTLQAKPNGGQSLNFSGAVRVRYIVRRLTPTECSRLQGFPDNWGHPDPKTELTDEEYAFWTEVRATHAVINGKEPKTYSREQILKWYNGLHTDSAEYKMWGNGIALPPALFCMMGMAEELKKEEHND